MMVIFNLANRAEVAAVFLADTAGRNVIAFNGEMGAGKTTFIHALCNELGVVDTVLSPTFSIINQYITAAGKTIYHMDLYRIKDEEEAVTAGVEDCLYSGNTCFVEWPEKAPGIFPPDVLLVTITAIDAESRKIEW